MIVRVLAEAESEIDTARRYLNTQAPGLGERFVDELSVAFEDIATRPLSNAKLETLAGEHRYRRALLKTFRYAVVFELLDTAIVVLAVAHTSRGPNYWLGRPT